MLKVCRWGGGSAAPQPAGGAPPLDPPLFFKTEHARGQTNNVANIRTSIRTTATTTATTPTTFLKPNMHDPPQVPPLSPLKPPYERGR